MIFILIQQINYLFFKMGGCCTTCLNRIDFVSDKYNKSIDRRDTFKTLSGGVLSILMLIFIVYLFFYFSSGIIYRYDYYFSIEEYFSPSSLIISISNPMQEPNDKEHRPPPYLYDYDPPEEPSFKFGFRVEDINGAQVDERQIFDYGFKNIIYNLTSPGYKRWDKTLTNVDFQNCSFITRNFYGDEKMNYYCPAKPFYFGGSWKSESIAIPIAYVKRCDANTEQKYSIKCLTNTELEKVGRLFFSTAVEKNLIENWNFTYPVQTVFEYRKVELSLLSSNSKRQKVTLNRAQSFTESGMLMSNLDVMSFYELRSIETEQFSNSDIDVEPNLASIEFYQSDYFTEHYRWYKNISEIVIGFFVGIQISLAIVRGLFHYFMYTEYLHYSIFKLYKFEIDNCSENAQQMQQPIQNIQVNNINVVNNEHTGIINDNLDGSLASHDIKEIKSQAPSNQIDISPSIHGPIIISQNYCGNQNRNINKNNEGNNDISHFCLNKDLNKVVEHKKKARQVINDVSYCDIFKACRGLISVNGDVRQNEQFLKYELIRNADYELTKRMNVVELQRKIYGFELLEKIILNEGQEFMIHNIHHKLMINNSNLANGVIRNFDEEKHIAKKNKLANYLGNMNTSTNIDEVLIKSHNDEFTK